MIRMAFPILVVMFAFWAAYGLVTHDLEDDD